MLEGRLSRDGGSTSSVGLIVATLFVAGAFGYAHYFVDEPAGRDPRSASLQSEATTLLDLIVRDPGRTAAASGWLHDPDAMTRFGLSDAQHPLFLDYDKVRALRDGRQEAVSNNKAPDYAEVRAALGITEGDFHLRSYPILVSVDDARWTKEQSLRVAYFAHYGGAAAPVERHAWVNSTAESLAVELRLTNRHTDATIFSSAISLGRESTNRDIITEERHTRLLLPGESQVLRVDFWSLASWDSQIDGVHFLIVDAYGNVAKDTSDVQVGDFWISSAPPPTAAPNAYNHLAYAADSHYETGRKVTFIVDHYDKDNKHVNNAKARLVVVGPDGLEWTNKTIDLPHQPNNVYKHECTCDMVGTYQLIVWDTAVERSHRDVVYVTPERMFDEKKTLSAVAANEISVLEGLLANFNPTRYHPDTNQEGDVFGDDKNGPSEVVDVLSRYSTLVIGSEVSQTALNSAETKYAIADWVSDEGGNLVVLGTLNQQSRWLEPVYHAAQETANGGIAAPDPTHPVLSTPDRLDYHKYLDRGRAWHIQDGDKFTHVLSRGPDGRNGMYDTLAVSEPGAFKNGTVVLTSYMPGSLTSPQDNQEARRLLHNLLSQSHTMLFMDFGPSIPPGVPVGSASRLAVIPHPNVPDVDVEVRLVLYRFG